MRTPFRIKVCGIRRIDDLFGAIEAGADAVGLNFFPASKRYVDPADAAKIASAAHGIVKTVGVFVNPTPSDVRAVLETCPMDLVQLHGDEHAEDWIDFHDRPIIKAVGWTGDESTARSMARWQGLLGPRLVAFLVDSYSQSERGGTGKTARWDLLLPRPACMAARPLILAGGLNAMNVLDGLQATHADGVDAASGVEFEPGVKDLQKMVDFAAGARRWFIH